MCMCVCHVCVNACICLLLLLDSEYTSERRTEMESQPGEVCEEKAAVKQRAKRCSDFIQINLGSL